LPGIVAFRSSLQSSASKEGDDPIEFDFIDGPHYCTPAPGIELFYPSPYYCFWKTISNDEITSARVWLDDLIARRGPYDGVMMFSQGCSLGSTVLLHHEKHAQQAQQKGKEIIPPPFKFAIFICGGAVLDQLEQELGFTVSPEARELDLASRKALDERASTSAILAQGSDRWKDVRDLTTLSGDELARLVTGPCQIKIPTVHIYGSKDPRYYAGLSLANLCDPQVRQTYDHGGGHEIPRKEVVSKTIAGLIRWVVNTADKKSQNGSS
jgi:hypothetical protein